MDDIKAKQQAKDEVTKNCMNIKEEIIEQIETPKVVEKVKEMRLINWLGFNLINYIILILTVFHLKCRKYFYD